MTIFSKANNNICLHSLYEKQLVAKNLPYSIEPKREYIILYHSVIYGLSNVYRRLSILILLDCWSRNSYNIWTEAFGFSNAFQLSQWQCNRMSSIGNWVMVGNKTFRPSHHLTYKRKGFRYCCSVHPIRKNSLSTNWYTAYFLYSLRLISEQSYETGSHGRETNNTFLLFDIDWFQRTLSFYCIWSWNGYLYMCFIYSTYIITWIKLH